MAIRLRYPVYIDIEDDFHCTAAKALFVELQRLAADHDAKLVVDYDSPLRDKD